jgi:RNA polymerase sigma-70 factor, ECF subfamily
MLQPAASPDLEEEFRRLFEQYFRPIYYFFRRRGIPPEDCHDLTQETFLRVYRGFRGFRGEAKFQTWLYQIASNLWCNQVRSRKAAKREGMEISLETAMEKRAPILPPLPFAPGSETVGPLARMLADEQLEALRRALGGLPPQMLRCVRLRIEREMKYREIAELMQISIDTVKSQLNQARTRLSEELGRYFDVPGLSGED